MDAVSLIAPMSAPRGPQPAQPESDAFDSALDQAIGANPKADPKKAPTKERSGTDSPDADDIATPISVEAKAIVAPEDAPAPDPVTAPSDTLQLAGVVTPVIAQAPQAPAAAAPQAAPQLTVAPTGAGADARATAEGQVGAQTPSGPQSVIPAQPAPPVSGQQSAGQHSPSPQTSSPQTPIPETSIPQTPSSQIPDPQAPAMNPAAPEPVLSAAAQAPAVQASPVQAPAVQAPIIQASATVPPAQVKGTPTQPAQAVLLAAAQQASQDGPEAGGEPTAEPDAPAVTAGAIKPAKAGRAQGTAQGQAQQTQTVGTGTDASGQKPVMAPPTGVTQTLGAQPDIVVADAAPDIKVSGADGATIRMDASARVEGPAPAQAGAAATPRADAAAIVRLAQQVGAKAGEGLNRFEIRMDPPELGRIEVRLHIDQDNRAHAVLLAERADTLSDLSRAARALERALEDSGLKLAQGGLEFGLKRDAPFAQGDGRQGAGRPWSGPGGEPGASITAAPMQAAADEQIMSYGFRIARAGRLMVRI